MHWRACPIPAIQNLDTASKQLAVACKLPASGSWTALKMVTHAWTGTAGPYYDALICSPNSNGLPGTAVRQDTVTLSANANWQWTFSTPLTVSEGDFYFVVVRPNASWTSSNWIRVGVDASGHGEPAMFSLDSGATWKLPSEGTLAACPLTFVINGQAYARRAYGYGGNASSYGAIYGARRYGLVWTPSVKTFVSHVSFHSTIVAGTPPPTRCAIYSGQTLVAASTVSYATSSAYSNISFDVFAELEPNTTYAIVMEAVGGAGDASNAHSIRCRTSGSNLQLATEYESSWGQIGFAASTTDPISWAYNYNAVPDMSMDVWPLQSAPTSTTRRPDFGGGFSL